jgi:cytoskeletal protein RodZ
LHFLRAIEAEEFEKLPGGIFNTSYLRQYARATGYDESELLAHYYKCNPPAEAEPASIKPERSFLDRWLRVPAVFERP